VTPADARAFLKSARDMRHREAADAIMRSHHAIDGDRMNDEAALAFLANVLIAGCSSGAGVHGEGRSECGRARQLGLSRWRKTPLPRAKRARPIATFETDGARSTPRSACLPRRN
jgi:hypothetical protein